MHGIIFKKQQSFPQTEILKEPKREIIEQIRVERVSHLSKIEFLFDGSINGKKCYTLLDNGATISLVSASFVKKVDCRKVDPILLSGYRDGMTERIDLMATIEVLS